MAKWTKIIIHVQVHDGKKTNEPQNHFSFLFIYLFQLVILNLFFRLISVHFQGYISIFLISLSFSSNIYILFNFNFISINKNSFS